MVIGSSGLPAPLISCMIALPMDVTRSVAWIVLPSISGCDGKVVTRPSQEPASVFSLSKDTCASDFCASAVGVIGALVIFASVIFASVWFVSLWAKPIVESNIRAAASVKRRDFMVYSPAHSVAGRSAVADSRTSYADIHNYITNEPVSSFLFDFVR